MDKLYYLNVFKKDKLFFNNVYCYYQRGGYWVILVENISNILVLTLVSSFLMFIIFFVNWIEIGECHSEETCKDLLQYIVVPLSFYNIDIIFIMFIILIMISIALFCMSIIMITEIFKYMKYRLYFKLIGINSDEIKNMSWLEIIDKMIAYDKSLNRDIIVGSIMKKDNFLIAIVSLNIFNMNNMYYTKSFIWLINMGIQNQIFDGKMYITKFNKIIINREKIKLSLKIIAIFQILLLPLIFLILIVHYVVNLTTDIYTKRTYNTKEWTPYARLLFREYNELPHIFDERIIKSYDYANKYEQTFNFPLVNVVVKKLIFVLGTYLTIFVMMALYDENLVLYMNLFDRNVIWYIAILTSLISLLRMMIINPSSIDESSDELLLKMSKHTHYLPNNWTYSNNKYETLTEFKTLYKQRFVNITIEIFITIILPWYILFGSFDDINTVIKFIEDNTTFNDDIGLMLNTNYQLNSQIDNYHILYEDDKITRSKKNFNNYYCNSIV